MLALVDSHCHLNMLGEEANEDDLLAAIQQAQNEGVEFILNVCVKLQDFPAVLRIAQSYPFIAASVGIHPNEPHAASEDEASLLDLANEDKVIAIGETGLDYYRSGGDLTWQQERFRRHIRVANQCQKPLIIHTRLASDDTLRLMREENAKNASGVMHCFTENWDVAKAALDLGFYISFSGIVTFKNARDIQEVAKKVPLDRLLIETDSPYLAPEPYRGQPNQPAYVRHTAEFIARLRGMALEEFASATTTNFYQLFKGAVLHV